MRTEILVVLMGAVMAAGTSQPPGAGGASSPPPHPVFQGWRPSERIVKTNYGKLRGRVVMPESKFGITLQPVEVFLGIPYVSPPIGTLRFLPPMNSPHWEDVREADHFGPVCPQKIPIDSNETASQATQRMPLARVEFLKKISRHLINQSEDCLFLNIYTPAKVARTNQKLPVVMFIHGGGYDWGSGNAYDGTLISSYANVVFVTINFRLGILGFFPAMEHASRANNGLLDQVAALHWIHRNIEAFGGDPDDVTIFGHGTGAACVNFLMMYPMAKDLFKRGVMMSGSALSPWAVARDAALYAKQVGRHLGCPVSEAAAFVECLRHRPVQDLIGIPLDVPDYLTAFGPTIDGSVVAGEPRQEMASLTSPFAQHDLLFGVVKFESYFGFSSHEEKHGFEAERRDRIIRTLVRNLYSFHQQEIFLTIINEYTDWTRSMQHPISVLEETAEALSDALVVGPIVETGSLHAQAVAYRRTHSTTNFYVFGYHSEDSLYAQRTGCVNGEDLSYVLGAPLLGTPNALFGNYSRQEAQLSEMVINYWANFFRSGSPNVSDADMESKNKLRSERPGWPDYEPLHQKFFTIGLKPKIRDHYHAHRLSIWNRLIPKLHRAGGAALSRDHHLLEDFDNQASYAGVVRNITLTTTSTSSPVSLSPPGGNPSHVQAQQPDIEGRPLLPNHLDGGGGELQNRSESQFMSGLAGFPQGTYSTALGVTIAVGCSLLILNILIFAGVYYQRDKGRGSSGKGKESHKVQVRPANSNSIRDTTVPNSTRPSRKASSREASTPAQLPLQRTLPLRKVSTLPRHQQRNCTTTASAQQYQAITLQRAGASMASQGSVSSSQAAPSSVNCNSNDIITTTTNNSATTINSNTISRTHHSHHLQQQQRQQQQAASASECCNQICLSYSEFQTLPHPPRSLLAAAAGHTAPQQLKMLPAHRHLVLVFSVVLASTDVDEILKIVGEAIDKAASPGDAARYKESAEKVRPCIEGLIPKLNGTTLSNVMRAVIPVAVECSGEIKGLDDAAVRKSKFTDCARSRAISLIMSVSDSEKAAFFEAKACVMSFMVEVLKQ
ncbi:neuroligin-4, X-linked [Galendromus occidentalis]|uniref:Neuroligin-4, X-linked n=1 Tax=Galendromus occidentalis TaxID=34638 RepID=A0AAJ7SIB7_9ACAR|nr:neuroligin-4, X-linked [Galendromus occidentalis]